MKEEVTILSVHYAESTRRFLEINYDLVAALNPVKNWIWIIGDNSHPSRGAGVLDAQKFPQVVKCFDQTNLDDVKPYFRKNGSYKPDAYKKKKMGCYWHGAALNKLLGNVRTRFLLVFDNNFYVVRPNWINDSIKYMIENDLAFFGAPNPPSNPYKYRYFPEVHCFFVDLKKVKMEDLDFMPAYETLPPLIGFRRQVRIVQYFLEKKAPTMFSKIFDIVLADHLRVGRSGDVGSRIASRYFGNPGYRVECVQQIFNPSMIYKFSDIFFPEHLSLIPKRSGYFVTGKSFLTKDLKKYGEHNWEAYLWKGYPFGFHIRSRAYNKFKTSAEWEDLYSFINETLGDLT